MAILGLIITCREFDEFIVSYLDDTLTARQRFLFKTHLLICPACRVYLERYKQTIAIAQGSFTKAGAGREVPDELVQAILVTKRADRDG